MTRLALIFFMLATPALADVNGYGHMMDHDFGYGPGFMFGPILWIVVLGLIVAGIIWFVRSLDSSSRQDSNKAMAELDLRFARGEIDADEYASRKKLLNA